MGEFEEKLNSILSSPKDMEKIMSLAQSLSSSLGTGSSNDAGSQPDSSDGESQPSNQLFSGANGSIDPKTIEMMSRIISAYSSNEGSEKASLLNSIKPYLRPERRDTIDNALNILKLTKIAKIAFTEFGGESHL